MGISDRIEAFIMELMKDEESYAEFGRNELADIFGCVPSQINYVIQTRFSPEKGYYVESRRGGGGYVKIRRRSLGGTGDVIAGIGKSCDFSAAKAAVMHLFERGAINEQAARILLAAVSDNAIAVSNPRRDMLRANILKNALCEL